METQNDVVDTGTTETQATTNETPQAATSEVTQEGSGSEPTQQNRDEGKRWTVKVGGQEMQLTEQELIKYAQLGKHGQRAMEKAADLEKRYKKTYEQLVAAAQRDMEQGSYSLYEALTGKRYLRTEAARNPATGQSTEETQADPRDAKLREYEDKIQRLEQRFEQEDIERERKAVEAELSDAITKYPALDTPQNKAYVKQQYARALKNGLDTSIEDVAFLVDQDIKAQAQKKNQVVSQKLEANQKQAPLITSPSSGKEVKKGGIDYARKLAGLTN